MDEAELERDRSALAVAIAAALERRRTGWSRADERRCFDCGGMFADGAGSFGGG